jgi:LmbE family N-acetylglucosaminyl deacetylase
MLSFALALAHTRPLRVLCIGAHSDDIEIGCAGALLTWLRASRPVHMTWVVLSAAGARATEARRSAHALLRGAGSLDVRLGEFRDGYFPAQYEDIKLYFEALKLRVTPDLILTHRLEDRHQDHRMAGELTWNTWRDTLILEYEIPKYEGDLGQPNLFVPLSAPVARRKATHLMRHFGTQRSRTWFSQDTFLSLARLRGIEGRAPSGFAEAFHVRKMLFTEAASR